MQNVELKAELRDRDLAETILMRLGGVRVATLEQTDTYYRISDGRLKKRQCADEPTEWIFYHRDERAAPRVSRFSIYTEREARERFGERPLPVWVIGNKTRDMWVFGPLRVHFDHVVGLGDFLEIEALITPKRDVIKCRDAVRDLKQRLEPALGEAISCGYADLASRDAAA